MIGGGKPTGGLQCSTSESPSRTWFGSSFSFVHKGDPIGSNFNTHTNHGLAKPQTFKVKMHKVFQRNGRATSIRRLSPFMFAKLFYFCSFLCFLERKVHQWFIQSIINWFKLFCLFTKGFITVSCKSLTKLKKKWCAKI